MTLRDVLQAATGLGFETRAVRLELSDLSALQLPCILHWNLDHFVVLERCSRRGAVILDPARGRSKLSMAQVSKHFTGVALELKPAVNFVAEPVAPRLRVRELLRGLPGLSSSVARILMLALSLELLVLAAPLASQIIIDTVLTTADRDLLLLVLGVFSALLLLQVCWGWLRGHWIRRLTQALTLHGQSTLLTRLLSLPPAFFERRGTGELAVRFESVAALQRTLSQGLTVSVIDGVMALTVLAMMVLYASGLALIVLAAVVVFAVVRGLIDIHLRQAAAERLALSAREQSHFLETLRCITAIKLHARVGDRRLQWQALAVDVANRDHRSAELLAWAHSLQTLIFGLEHLAVIGWGAHTILHAAEQGTPSPLTVGMLVAFLAYRGQFVARVGALMDAASQWRLVRLHLDHLADIALEPPEAEDPPQVAVASPPPQAGRPHVLELRDLGFRHTDSSPWLFRGLNLRVDPGEMVAIAGPSGVGKSTLVRIILGLIEPTEGQVLYDGHTPAQRGLVTHRQAFGAVLQDDCLLNGSVADNIAFLDPSAQPERIVQCATQACLHDDIQRMPMGYHTPVGEMGHWLSGGQRQRLLLARALYQQPAVLVLDEATSHLDVGLELKVNASVQALALTRIVVAHRPQTLAAADRVVHLKLTFT